MAFTYVTVTRDYDFADGTDPGGWVTFTPVSPMINGGVTVVSAARKALLNVDGQISIDLAACTDTGTLPAGNAYRVVEQITDQTTRTYYVVIPHDAGASVDLGDLDTVAAPSLTASAQPLDLDLTVIAGLTAANDDVLQRKSGAWANRTLAQLSTDLGLPGSGSTTPQAYGAVGNGTTDDSAAFASALSAASSGKLDLVIPPGTYKLNSGITWDCEAGSVRGQGLAILDFTGMTSGYAITVEGVNGRGSSYNNRSTTHEITGLQITGPDTDGTTVDGFLIQDVPSGSGNLSQVNVSDLYVYGFRDQFYFGDNTWCWRFQNCALGHAHRRVLAFWSGLNAGENYSFYGCTFFSSTNASTHAATAAYGDVGGNTDAYFYGCSFDYNDIEFDWNSGVLNLIGCHVEDHANNSNPMGKLTYTGGNAHTTLTVVGGDLSPTESTPGRDHLIETTGDHVSLAFSGVKVGCYGMGTDLVKVISGAPGYSWQGGDLDTNTGAVISSPGSLGNVLRNGDFELGSTSGWSNGGTITYSAQTGTVSSGTYALKMAGTGVTATSFIRQVYTCPANVAVIAYADLAADTVTGGSVAFQVQFKAQDLSTISTTTVATISANQSMTRAGTKVRTPAGTAYVYVLFAPTNLNGNVYADNVYASIMAPSSGSALLTFGTSSNTITEGNDTRVTGAAQKASNLSDLASVATARTNLGVNPDVQVFTSSGTWTKPSNVTVVDVVCIGGGGGGGSGARRASGTATSGGGGGGGGGWVTARFRASDFSSTETVTVGTGGAGAAAITGNDTDGSSGSNGNVSSFGTTVRARSNQGTAGGGGGTATSSAGSGGGGLIAGTSGATGTVGAAGTNASTSSFGPAGGGSGGGVATTPTAFTGGNGAGQVQQGSSGGGAGGAINTTGTAGTAAPTGMHLPGAGGGGGGSSITTTAGTGGAAGTYGAGGGGGGSSLNGQNSGAGGAGAAGIVVVISE